VVDKTVAVSSAGRKTRAHSREEDLPSGVRLKRDLAFEYEDELILSGMGVTMGRLSAGHDPRHDNPVVLQSGVVAEASIVAVLGSLPDVVLGSW